MVRKIPPTDLQFLLRLFAFRIEVRCHADHRPQATPWRPWPIQGVRATGGVSQWNRGSREAAQAKSLGRSPRIGHTAHPAPKGRRRDWGKGELQLERAEFKRLPVICAAAPRGGAVACAASRLGLVVARFLGLRCASPQAIRLRRFAATPRRARIAAGSVAASVAAKPVGASFAVTECVNSRPRRTTRRGQAQPG
jgi:hypothetical protein